MGLHGSLTLPEMPEDSIRSSQISLKTVTDIGKLDNLPQVLIGDEEEGGEEDGVIVLTLFVNFDGQT